MTVETIKYKPDTQKVVEMPVQTVGIDLSKGAVMKCIDLPLTVQLGAHKYEKLTPQEAYDKGFIADCNGYPWKAYVGLNYTYPYDWTRKVFKATVPIYTATETELLEALSKVRDIALEQQNHDIVMLATSILKKHEVNN